jgi:hypothetical protein
MLATPKFLARSLVLSRRTRVPLPTAIASWLNQLEAIMIKELIGKGRSLKGPPALRAP